MSGLLDHTDVALILFDAQQRISQFTPAAGDLLALGASDIGRLASDLPDRAACQDLATRTELVLQQSTAHEQEVQADDGAWYLRRIAPCRAWDGHIEGLSVLFIEITARKRQEDSLRALNASLARQVKEQNAEAQLLLQAVEQNPVSVIITDTDGNIEYVNPAFEQISGYQMDEVLGRNPRLLQSGDTPPAFYREIWDTLVAGETWQGEFHNRRKSGELYWARSLIAPVLDATGKTRHYVGQQRDITRDKTVTKALEESEAHLRALVDNAAEAIVTVDTHDIVLDFNPAAEQLFGYRTQQIQGSHLAQLLTHPSIQQISVDLLRSNGRWQEFTGLHRDGGEFPVELVASKVARLGFYVLLIRDLSHRRSLEREIIEASAMEQERIGHEIHDGIGQQLTGISMLTKSLMRKLEVENCRAGLSEAGELMAYLEQTVESAKKLASGLSPINFTPDGLIPAIATLVKGIQSTSGLSFDFRHSDDVGAISKLQAIQIYRICQEALNNVVKHAAATKVRVWLQGSDSGLVASIEDDGVGITPLWEKNEGLGMHIMQYRADIIGARLTVKALEGGGTRLHCILPTPSEY